MSVKTNGRGSGDLHTSHRRLIAVIRILIITIPVVVLLGLAASWGVFLAIAHHLHGRAGICTLGQSLEGVRLSALQSSESKNIRNKSSLVTTDSQGFKQWATPMGTYWIPANNEGALAYDLAEQKRKIYGTGGRTAVHAGDIVLDCGANVGVFTREALTLGAKLVVAIEPAPENVECLRRNFSVEIAQGRVVVYPKGVWDKKDVLTLRVDPNNSARDSFVTSGDATEYYNFVRVPLTTVDELTRELNLPKVDFIKMDIEGAETKAIAGARRTITKYRPRMALCLYHLRDDQFQIPALVRNAVADYNMEVQCLCGREIVQAQVAHFY